VATNTVEIELEVKGDKEAISKIGGVGEAASGMAEAFDSEGIMEGLEGVGDTASQMAERFSTDNEKLGEGLGELTGSISATMASVVGLRTAFAAAGTTGIAAWASLLGPIAAVAGALYGLYEVYQLISGGAQEAEEAQENMAAASADLASKLEALAEKGVVPATEDLLAFTEQTILAQFAKDALETSMTKNLLPAMKKHQKALSEQTELQKQVREGDKLSAAEARKLGEEIVSQNTIVVATRDKLREGIQAHLVPLKEMITGLKGAGELEQKFEEMSAESLLAIIKENEAKSDGLRLLQQQTILTDQQAKIFENSQKEERAVQNVRLEANKEDLKFLRDRAKEAKAMLALLDQEAIIRKAAAKDLADINKAAADKTAAEEARNMAQSRARRAAARAKRLAKEAQLQAELQQIRALEIENIKINGASAIEVLNLRYQEEVKLAKGNANKILAAVKRYENQVTLISQEEQAKRDIQAQEEAARRLEAEKRQAEQRANLIYDSMQFDAELREDSTSKELTLLELKYARELEMNEHTQEQITELNRRQAIERQNIINQSIDAQIEKVGEFANQYGAGLAEAAYSSLLFGESFSEATGQILIALGRQAAIQSLMELAKGTAALFIPGGQATAAGHFKASALFAGASVAAGVTGKSLGGGGGGSSAAASPTGSPQIAPTPERETAEETSMVFNINFGGAVIYDTQRAAEVALADRITNLQNTRRRGAPRRAF
jgi:predicted metalloprotease